MHSFLVAAFLATIFAASTEATSWSVSLLDWWPSDVHVYAATLFRIALLLPPAAVGCFSFQHDTSLMSLGR